MKIVWTIAGSDSCCGAGAQRDIAVMHDLGVYPCMLITALTAQSSITVDEVRAVDLDFFRQNLKTLMADLPPATIKIGLIPSLDILQEIKNFLASFKDHRPPVVLDPVCVASTGQSISKLSATPDDFKELYPFVDLITPNLVELQILAHADHKAETMPEIMEQVRELQAQGLKNILVKGGHSTDQIYVHDLLIEGDEHYILRSKRAKQNNKHGTGCTISAAIASYLAQDYFLYDAVTASQMYISKAIFYGQRVGHGNGTPGFVIDPIDVEFLPQVVDHFEQIIPQYSFKQIDESLELYPIVDSIEWVRKLLSYGVKTIQLRIKDPQYEGLEAEIVEAVALGEQYKAKVFIDDYWELAIKHHAYGVHLGQEDLMTADLNKIAASGIALGVSTHGFYEIARAVQLNPSYIALGHIFPTQTKKMKSDPQGLERLKLYSKLLKNFNTVAIGGIKESNFNEVLATGVKSIAVVTAITKAPDPKASTQRLMQFFKIKSE